jgi:hypothetical protein
MTTKRKPAIRARKTNHCCTQEENLRRMNEILIGNGHPEDGLAFRFKEFMIDHKLVVADINTIKQGVEGLHTRADNNAKAAATAQSAIERFKLETKSYDQGVKDREAKEIIAEALATTKKRDSRQLVFWIITAVVAILSVWLSIYSSLNNGRKINEQNANQEWVDSLRAIQKRGSTTVRGIPMGVIPNDKLKDSLRYDSLMKIYRK